MDLDGRTYCVYTEQQSGALGYIIARASVRDVTGGSCKDGGAPVTGEIATAVLARLATHFQRLGIRSEIR